MFLNKTIQTLYMQYTETLYVLGQRKVNVLYWPIKLILILTRINYI